MVKNNGVSPKAGPGSRASHEAVPSSPEASIPNAAEREALNDCVGALQFILAFYDPSQRHLDTEAWKAACASGVAAYRKGATLLGWCQRPIAARNGEVHYDAYALSILKAQAADASAIEARRAATENTGAVHESATEGDAQTGGSNG